MNVRISLARLPVLTAAAAITAVFGISACAAATPAFNPDGLPQAQLDRVDQVCEGVMGLSPKERLIGGQWLGDSRLEYWTSRYRGCVTSLSDSMQSGLQEAAAAQADHDCRAKGYAGGSADLALCVLDATKRAPANAQTVSQTSGPALPTASGSLFYASASERQRREELACAAIGIEPNAGAFKACVHDLQNTFHAIDTPIS